jgi:hypothetical protein
VERPLEGEVVQPPSEAVHLPEPSYLPVIVAAGITVAVIGVVVHFGIVVLGAAVTLFAIVRWIRETREGISELPLDH